MALEGWFKETSDSTLAYPPYNEDGYAVLYVDVQHGGLNGGGADFSSWFGLSDGTTSIVDGITGNTFDQITQLEGVHACVLISGHTDGDYSKGGLYVLQRDDAGVMQLTHEFYDAGTDEIDNGDRIGIAWKEGGVARIWRRKSGETHYNEIAPLAGVDLPAMTNNPVYAAAGCYNAAASTAEADLQLKSLGGSFGTSDLNKYGQFLKYTLDANIATPLGISTLTDENDTSGTANDASLMIRNDKQLVANQQVSEECPFVNINIRNLPCLAYTSQDTRNEGLSSSATIGAVSRFDRDGSLNHIQSLYTEYPTHYVQLKNAEQIELTQFHFDLRDSDGQLPTDLSTPLGLVFEIVPQPL